MVKKVKVHSEHRIVMFIDIVSYTPTTAALDREKFDELHNVFDSISLSLFERFGGQVIQKVGDAYLATFNSPTNAVLCGIELQKTFGDYNKQHRRKEKPLRIRVAIHSGEVLLRKNDVLGDAVNTTARIESITKADDVVFSESVYKAMNKNEIPSKYIGAHKLKGLKHSIKLFKVKTKQDIIAARRKAVRKALNSFKWGMVKVVILLIFIILVWYGSRFLLSWV